MKKRRHGLAPISGDPITRGHLDVIRRSAKRCERLTVVVLDNDKKKRTGAYLFTLAERQAMAERAVKESGMKNVRVISSPGLLVDVYLREGCDMLYRGVRDAQDRAYERGQKEVNQLILRSVKFETITSPIELRMVSSSMVKEFVSQGLGVDRFAPMFVKRLLEERMLGRYSVAVTGPIAVGKSWVAKELVRQLNANRVPAALFNIDDLIRKLYAERSEGAQNVRDALQKLCGRQKVLTANRRNVDRKALASLLFREGRKAAVLRDAVTELTMPHVESLYRETLHGFKGLAVVEWAQLAEMDMSPWTNNNVIVVDSPHRQRFLSERGIDPERLAVMEKIQWSVASKVEALGARARRDCSGRVMKFTNRRLESEVRSQMAVTALRNEVLDLFPDLRPAKT